MKNKIFLGIVFAALVLSVGITPAFAMSGTVKTTGGLIINGAWVTSEKTNDYHKITQPSTGTWNLSIAGNGNTVSGAPYLYNRGVQTNVNNNAINVDFSLSTRTAETMEYVIAVASV